MTGSRPCHITGGGVTEARACHNIERESTGSCIYYNTGEILIVTHVLQCVYHITGGGVIKCLS